MQIYEQVNQLGLELTPNKSTLPTDTHDVDDNSPLPHVAGEHIVLVRQ